jgi:hypothetical protein
LVRKEFCQLHWKKAACSALDTRRAFFFGRNFFRIGFLAAPRSTAWMNSRIKSSIEQSSASHRLSARAAAGKGITFIRRLGFGLSADDLIAAKG